MHATKAGKMHPAAIEYRLHLWRAIQTSPGFVGGFANWWPRRQVKHPHAPLTFPVGLPTSTVVEAVFLDYRDNYRRFEAWSIRQRASILKARHEAQRDLVFKDLREPRSPQVDTLILNHTYAILAVDDDTRSVHVDEPVDCRGHSTWTCDGTPCDVDVREAQTCTIGRVWPVQLDQELIQTVVLSDVQDIHSEFVKLWAPRWNRQINVSASDWQRITAFAEAYLPCRPLQLTPISLVKWRAALKRFRPRAARGVDGFAKADLQNMDDTRALQLLDFFAEIERGTRPWPKQWIVGMVCSLVKPNGKLDANGFRPICIFAVAYRAWASIRARQLLHWLAAIMPPSALGFLPRKETKMFWWCIEALVESALQAGETMAGFCPDVVKAFNCLPRGPILNVARCMGAPDNLLVPWTAFLEHSERRFLVRGFVSEAIPSTNGFAEGCPLSPVAMVFADCIWHAYLSVFQPRVLPFSYVDNFTCLAESVGDLASGINCTRAFADMMKLELDDEKTYVWGLGQATRAQLAMLRIPVLAEVKELGGRFAFGASVRNSGLVTQCRSLDEAFHRLARSRSPLAYKLAALPAKFWASALHAVSGCPLGEAHLNRLRAQAVKALKIHPAGSSAILRLSISCPMTADPGFYTLWICLSDARRMLIRCPALLPLWQAYMQAYDGAVRHGPFTKLVQVCSQIGWRLQHVPAILDHNGCHLDLLSRPITLLRRRAAEGWLLQVGIAHQHRASMHDLVGIDAALLRASTRGLSSHNVARTRALQSGAFVFGAAKSKFDVSCTGLCGLCQVADTKQHRVCECPAYAPVRDTVAWISRSWSLLPTCLTHHLLAPCNPHVQGFVEVLQGLPDCTRCFYAQPSADALQHIFTDGSCFQHDNSNLSQAAWGAVLSNTASVIACGQLHGALQTTPRAELTAMLSALSWIALHAVQAVIWTDALNQVSTTRLLLEGGSLPEDLENEDVWRQIQTICSSLRAGTVKVHHTPGHLRMDLCQSPFEEWLCQWNAHADTVARLANINRPVASQQRFREADDWHTFMLKALRALQTMYFHIADVKEPVLPIQDEEEANPERQASGPSSETVFRAETF